MNELLFKVGDKVKVVSLPPYLKTAESMPMLRPSSLINIGDEGIILKSHPANYWSVKFEKGSFLVDTQYLQKILDEEINQ